MATVPNQSFLVKNMTTKMAACLAGFLHEVTDKTWWVGGAWGNPFAVLYYATGWRKNAMKFAYRRNPGDNSGKLNSLEFNNARWDPNKSQVNYGPKKLAQNVEVSDDAKTKIIENDSDTEVHVAYEEAVELTNSFSTNVTEGMTLDMSASSETTVSGEYAGVSAEEKVTLSMGVSTSKEESKEKSEEGTQSESLSIDFDAKPRSYYMITITKEHQTTYQDFEAEGVMDFDTQIYLEGNHGGRLGKHYPGNYVKVQGIDGLDQFFKGYDTAFPAMQGYWGSTYTRAKNGINWIMNPENRRLSIKGTNQASLESNADYKVEQLTHGIPDNLKHLPVVDANSL